jgi:hypothetical protein
MAFYKNFDFFTEFRSENFDDKEAFDVTYKVHQKAYAGIYRCTLCGNEIAIAGGHPFPPQHTECSSPVWQLIVAAEHKPKNEEDDDDFLFEAFE